MRQPTLAIGLLIIILALTLGYVSRNAATSEMSLEDARAVARASVCTQDGRTLKEGGTRNENTKTWWIDLNYPLRGCAPACVVSEETRGAEINERCTGLLPEEQTVSPVTVYFYDPAKDTDAEGNLLCSRQGLVPITRELPTTETLTEDAVRSVLQGPTEAERASGAATEFPLSGLALVSSELKDSVLTLHFSDPENKTSGGACRVSILWFQIEATAKQFPGIRDVRFEPEYLFQP